MKDADLTQMVKKCDEVSQLLKSLSHPIRLKVLCHILDGEKTVNELTAFCGISQSAMSQFLSRMKDEGVLNSRREGAYAYYSLGDPRIVKLMKTLKDIFCK